ncbi:MAG TPA: hypothetical protein VN227_04080 [Methanoregula sp.]|nr:hypothetical protein [Methanoregula sp.]
MKKVSLSLIFLTLMLCIFFAGCVQNTSPSPTTPVPTVAVTTPQQTVPPTQSCSLVPGPTQMVPSYQSVSVSVDRNTITSDPTITVTFNGGQGNGMVQQMNVTVVRSDCVTEQAARKNPVMGESVTLMGTLKTDRVIVVMTMTSGDQYTIIDKDYPFPMQVQPV